MLFNVTIFDPFLGLMPEEQKEVDNRLLFDYKTFFQSLIPSCCKKSKYAFNNGAADENVSLQIIFLLIKIKFC